MLAPLRVLIAVAVLAAGCREDGAAPRPTPTHVAANGIGIVVPEWLEARAPTRVADVIAEVEAETLPHGWIVVVEAPVYVASYRDTTDPGAVDRPGLVRGHTDYDSREVHVGWRAPCEAQSPCLPALSWECANARRDPGHVDPYRGGE